MKFLIKRNLTTFIPINLCAHNQYINNIKITKNIILFYKFINLNLAQARQTKLNLRKFKQDEYTRYELKEIINLYLTNTNISLKIVKLLLTNNIISIQINNKQQLSKILVFNFFKDFPSLKLISISFNNKIYNLTNLLCYFIILNTKLFIKLNLILLYKIKFNIL